MAGRRSGASLGRLRSALYGAARLLGDIQAVRRGPTAIAKRAGRRALGRLLGRLFR